MHQTLKRTAFSAVVLSLMAAGLIYTAAASSALTPGVSFGAVNQSTWQTNNVVWGIASGNNVVLAGGSFTQVRPPDGTTGTTLSQAGLVLLNADTGAPTSCQFTIGGTARVRTVITTSDGSTAYIGGEFSSVNGVSRNRLAALDLVNCKLKTAFNAGPISAEVMGMAVSGNTLYIAGGFSTVNSQSRSEFAALNASTGALLPWTADGQSFSDANAQQRGRAVAVSPDGTKVALGGFFYYINGQYSHSIALVSAADPSTGEGGSVLRAYPPGFIPGDPSLTSAANAESPGGSPSGSSSTQVIISGGSDGMFYIGNEGTGGGIFDGRAAFRWSDGEQVWRDTCLGATQSLVIDSGTLYAANHEHDCSSINYSPDGLRVYLTAQNSQTMVHYGWRPQLNDGTGEGIGGRALTIAVGASGKRYLWVGGEFTNVNGGAQQGLTRFSDQSSAPATPTPVIAKAMPNGTIQVRFRTVIDSDDSILTYSLFRNGGSTPIDQVQGTSEWWTRPQVTFVDANVVPGTSYTYTVKVTDGTSTRTSASTSAKAVAASSTYASLILADHPAQLYFDSSMSGTWVHDARATTTAGNLTGGLAVGTTAVPGDGAVTGDTSGSLQFNGTSDYVWEDQLLPGPSVYSVETWIKTTTTSGGKIIGFGNGRPKTNTGDTVLSGSYDRHVYMTNDGRLVFGAYAGGTNTVTSSASYNDGKWHQVVATQGSGGMALYVDGIQVGKNANAAAQSYYGVWHLGGDNLNGWPNRPSSNFFAGQIDETSIYDRVLSRSDVLAHAEAGGLTVNTNPRPADAYGQSVYDQDPDLYWRLNEPASTSVAADSAKWNQRPGVYSSAVTHGSAGVVAGDSAVTMTGNNSSTVGTSTSGGNPSTYSEQVWFRTSASRGGKLAGIENTQTGNGSSYDKNLYMTDAGKIVFGTYVGSFNTVTSANSYNDGAWHQATGTQDSSGTKLYIDGVLVGSNTQAGSESFTGYWRIGGGNLGGWPSAPSNYYFTGDLDEFAVYSSALPASTIQSQYLLIHPDTQAPSVPSGLTAALSGADGGLTWNASTDNVGVTAYKVYRGAAADFVADDTSLLATVPAVAGSSSMSYADVNAPSGTWYYKVIATDGSGNASGASTAAQLVVPDLVAPSVPAGLTATVGVGSSDVVLSWQPATDNVAVSGYRVYRGDSASFVADDTTKIADVATVAGATSYAYTDAGRPTGTSYYQVIAVDSSGNASAPAASVAGVVPDTAAPSTPIGVTAVVNAAQQVQVTWTASTDNVGVDTYVVYRGAASDFVPADTNRVGFSTGTSYTETAPAGNWYYRIVAVDAAGNASPASVAAAAVVTDTTAPTVPTQVQATASGSTVNVTWSASSDNEAVTGYRVYRGTASDFTTSTGTLVASVAGTQAADAGVADGSYYYRVLAVDAAGNTSDLSGAAAVTVSTADTVAPSVPAGVAASVSGSDVTVSWSASSDNVAVTGYRVFRGASSGFTADSSSQVGSVSGVSFKDAGVADGTYYYRVAAVDGAGNVSDASTAVKAVVSTAVQPVTVQVRPTDDAAVSESTPTVNSGTDTQLWAKRSPGQQAFILVDVPAAPAGTVLTGASLSLRTSTDSSAGSTGQFRLDLVTGSWTESGVTWNNRPTTVGAKLATVTPATASSTRFDTDLDVSKLQDSVGKTVTIRLWSDTSDDNLRVGSAESGSNYRPVLTFTFS